VDVEVPGALVEGARRSSPEVGRDLPVAVVLFVLLLVPVTVDLLRLWNWGRRLGDAFLGSEEVSAGAGRSGGSAAR
jgi:hypothetical protein